MPASQIRTNTAARPQRPAVRHPRRTNPNPRQRATLVGRAYHKLRRKILDNVYPPGHIALEQSLANALGISRTPLREALIRLEQEGLVEIVPRRGVRVLPVSADDMRDIYEILTALEPMAAELAAKRRLTEMELQPLVQASRDMETALHADDRLAWAEADERFHRHLIELSGNPLLVQMVLNVWDRAHRARMLTLHLRPQPVHSTREHMAMVGFIRAGRAEEAFAAYRAHRERGSRELLELLERNRLRKL